MPFVPVKVCAPVRLSSNSETPNIFNIKEIPILKEQLTRLQARNLEPESELREEQEDKHELEVEAIILEMELENEREKNRHLQVHNTNLQNTLLALTADYNQLEAELNKTKVELAKTVEKSKFGYSSATWKWVSKSRKGKKKQIRYKCCICRNSFSNPIILRRHQKLCRISSAGSSSSSKATSMIPLRCSSPNSLTNTTSISQKLTPSSSTMEVIPANTFKAASSANSSEASLFPNSSESNRSPDVSKSTSSCNTSEAMFPTSPMPTSNYPKAPTAFEFVTPKSPPMRSCSVALFRIPPKKCLHADSSSSVVVEFQRTRNLLTAVKKHSRDLTKRDSGCFYCLCGIQFLNRRRLDRHLTHQAMISQKAESPVWKPSGHKKKRLADLISKVKDQIKVEKSE